MAEVLFQFLPKKMQAATRRSLNLDFEGDTSVFPDLQKDAIINYNDRDGMTKGRILNLFDKAIESLDA